VFDRIGLPLALDLAADRDLIHRALIEQD
jgi:hypothetical protein